MIKITVKTHTKSLKILFFNIKYQFYELFIYNFIEKYQVLHKILKLYYE